MFDYIRDDVNPDAIFWVGDTISHNLGSQTAEENIRVLKNATEEVAKAFPNHKGKIFPVIGNHDTYP